MINKQQQQKSHNSSTKTCSVRLINLSVLWDACHESKEMVLTP